MRRMEVKDQGPKEEEQGKLRRWVSNLQLESWQLELLITGFSIFLLASSLEEYDNFRSALIFEKLSPGSNAKNPLFALSGQLLLNAIPWALRFFLINLLVHLLLRGFWIGIVGLSSVSAVIDYDKLKLKGKFRKYIPQTVKTLDELILYLDKVSSVIFAYTYLLVFAILSVAIIFVFTIALFGIIMMFSASAGNNAIFFVINLLLSAFAFLFIISAALFFIDSIFFSTFKKSKWFSSIFYYIYRFFSVISLSFVYRSIYYHLITNYRKKQIIVVNVVLVGLFIMWSYFTGWNLHKFYPHRMGETEFLMRNAYYDDVRGDAFVKDLSIPSKYVDNGFLEIFIHYDPKYNDVMRFRCPDAEAMDGTIQFSDGFKAGMEAGMDTTKSVDDFLPDTSENLDRVKSAAACLSEMFIIKIDDEVVENTDFSYYTHPSKGEKGFLLVLDIVNLPRGKHTLEVDNLEFNGILFMQDISEDKLEFKPLARLPFWSR